MGVLRNNLLNCELPSTLNMSAQPNQAETSSTQQLDLFEAIRESVTKGLFLFFSKSITFVGDSVTDIFFMFFYGLDSPLVLFLDSFSTPLTLIFLNIKRMIPFFFVPLEVLLSVIAILFLVPETDLVLVD